MYKLQNCLGLACVWLVELNETRRSQCCDKCFMPQEFVPAIEKKYLFVDGVMLQKKANKK